MEISVPHQYRHALAERALPVVDVMPALTLLDPENLMEIMVMKILCNWGIEKAARIVVVVPGGDKAF
jgi:hypothetical protein